VLTSDGTTWTSQAATGGQLKTELFTAPGTWTKPASCTQVRVTVIGGGGGNSQTGAGTAGSGNTSSFGSAVSATGGNGGVGPPSTTPLSATPGTGTVSTGTTLRSGTSIWGISGGAGANNTVSYVRMSYGNIIGNVGRSPVPGGAGTSNIAYSISSPLIAGSRGGGVTSANGGGDGGLAIAIVPVSAPVSITVGTGGAAAVPPSSPPTSPSTVGGVDGAILVEFVG
jgi:hypothetical protein